MKQFDATIQVDPLTIQSPQVIIGQDLNNTKDVDITLLGTVNNGQITVTKLIQEVSHDQLLKALYWVYDFMDRAMINFFLVGDTAQAVLDRKDLYGDKVMVGVRKLEWESGSRRIADSFALPLADLGSIVYYEYEGVLVMLFVLEDDVTISSLDQMPYASEYFKVPNPYSEFIKVFPWIENYRKEGNMGLNVDQVNRLNQLNNQGTLDRNEVEELFSLRNLAAAVEPAVEEAPVAEEAQVEVAPLEVNEAPEAVDAPAQEEEQPQEEAPVAPVSEETAEQPVDEEQPTEVEVV